MHPTPQSLLRLYGSAYQGHDFVAWLGDPLYSRDSYAQLGFDLVMWLRGNFRMEWGFENQWVDGRWMNTYQVNFVWGEAFHCLSRRPMFDNDPQTMPPEPWHAAGGSARPRRSASSSLPPAQRRRRRSPLARLAAVSRRRLAASASAAAGEAPPPRDAGSAEPASPLPVQAGRGLGTVADSGSACIGRRLRADWDPPAPVRLGRKTPIRSDCLP